MGANYSLLYHVRLMTYYMNPHPALWAPLSQAWERGRGRGLDIVTVYTDMILRGATPDLF